MEGFTSKITFGNFWKNRWKENYNVENVEFVNYLVTSVNSDIIVKFNLI